MTPAPGRPSPGPARSCTPTPPTSRGGRPATGLRVTGLQVRDRSHATATVVADEDVVIDTYVVVAMDGTTTSNGLTLEVQL